MKMGIFRGSGWYGRFLLVLTVKTIARSRDGQEQSRVDRIGFNFAAKMPNIDVQVMRVFIVIGAPHLREQHLLCHNLPAILYQDFQQVIFNGGKFDFLSIHRDVALCEVHLKRPNTQHYQSCGRETQLVL